MAKPRSRAANRVPEVIIMPPKRVQWWMPALSFALGLLFGAVVKMFF